MSVVSVPRCGSALSSISSKVSLRSLTVLLGLIVAAASAHATTYTVKDTADSATDTGSIRSAVNSVNAGSGGDTINITALGTITLTNGTLGLSKNVTILGPGAALLTISGNKAVTVVMITSPITVTISGLTIANGFNTNGGFSGGVFNSGGTVTLTQCTFASNIDASAGGGAILNVGTMMVNRSTFVSNNGGNGAVYNNSGTLTVNNSTFTGNTGNYGAAIDNAGQLNVNNSTITGNTASHLGGGIYLSNGAITLTNSIVAGNTTTGNPSGDCDGCGSQSSNNLISTTASPIDPTSLHLGPLQYNGGLTQTMMLLASSPAINAGQSSTLNADQRGFIRATSGSSDLGAVQTYYLTVTDTTDTNDGSCISSKCSLRDAITVANANKSGDILFASGVTGKITLTSSLPIVNYNLNLVGPGASSLTVDGASLYTLLNIKNSGTNIAGITIANGYDNTANTPGIYNQSGALTLSNCVVSGNKEDAVGGDGGGIFNKGTMMMTNCVVTGNTAVGNDANSAVAGGVQNKSYMAIANSTISNNIANDPSTTNSNDAFGVGIDNDGSMVLTGSTVSGNIGTGISPDGGGIESDGTLTVINSTISGNVLNDVNDTTSLGGYGGGIEVFSGKTTILTSTISGNVINSGTIKSTGGGLGNRGKVTLSNSIVAGNTTPGNVGDDCDSCGTQTAENIISATGAVITAAQVNLGPLALNGEDQTVQTMLPLPGSLAIATGNPALLTSDITTDERRQPRTISSLLDVGAVETNYTSIQFVQQPVDGWIGLALAPVTLSVTESGLAAINIPVPLTLSGSGVLAGTTTQTTVIPTGGTVPVATYNDLSINTAGSDTLDASLTITPATAATPVVLTASSGSFKVQPASFSITAAPSSLTVTAGKSGTIVFTLTALGGYNGTVTLSCGTLPAHSSCAFSPASVTMSSTPSTVTLTFATNLTTADLQWLPRVRSNNPLQGLPVLPAMLFWLPETVLDRKKNASKSEKKRMPKFLMMGAMVALTLGALAISGCGGSSAAPVTNTHVTPAGQQAVTITATGTSNVTQTLSVNITVQ